jgi:hypothetical protein
MRADTITADIGRRVTPGRVLGIDVSADVLFTCQPKVAASTKIAPPMTAMRPMRSSTVGNLPGGAECCRCALSETSDRTMFIRVE